MQARCGSRAAAPSRPWRSLPRKSARTHEETRKHGKWTASERGKMIFWKQPPRQRCKIRTSMLQSQQGDQKEISELPSAWDQPKYHESCMTSVVAFKGMDTCVI
eukprot:3833861-Pleurochrysis_carterae.AAC.1